MKMYKKSCDDDNKEEVVTVEGAVPCRITPSKKTLTAIENLAKKYGCVHCHHELTTFEKQLYLYLAVSWRKVDFEEKLLQRFNDALLKVLEDSKEFLLKKAV
jgi:hypothetical protein